MAGVVLVVQVHTERLLIRATQEPGVDRNPIHAVCLPYSPPKPFPGQ